MKPTIRKRTLPHHWLQNQWNARWTLRTCQTSLQCAWLISCIMLHGYMFMIQPRGLDTCACGDIGRSRYTTHVVLNLILLISRDAIHFLLFAGTLIGLLSCYRLMIGTSWVYAGSIVALRMTPRVIYPAGINTQPPCVPRLAITLSSYESVARSSSSLIWAVMYRRNTRIVFRGCRRDS